MASYGSKNQFQASIGIDPSWPISVIAPDLSLTNYDWRSSGYLRPVPSKSLSSGSITSYIPWIKSQPKVGDTLYMYGANGSAYSYVTGNITGLSDTGALSSSSGNGLEYYDNYMYFAKDTDIARYGPLNGSPTFNGTYWTGTLGKAALTNTTTYPFGILSGSTSNHVMHRHSDGKLYIADVVGNQGTIHTIQTTKTTVEGDTDNGSTFSKLALGYGLWPTAIESYGSGIVIGLLERAAGVTVNPAKIVFWDTVSQNYNTIIFDEFTDTFISAIKNINGTLYIVSSPSSQGTGFRVSQYIGGSSIKTVAYIPSSTLPSPGAVDAAGERIIFGVRTVVPEPSLSVLSLGLQNPAMGRGLFNVLNASGFDLTGNITAVSLGLSSGVGTEAIVAANTDSSATISDIKNSYSEAYSLSTPSSFWSQKFQIGRPFKITKIRFPMAQAVGSNMIVTPKIYTDDADYNSTAAYTGGSSPGLAVINNTNYSGKKNIVMRPVNLTGGHNFWLELRWTGTASCTLALPIEIIGEYIDD